MLCDRGETVRDSLINIKQETDFKFPTGIKQAAVSADTRNLGDQIEKETSIFNI